MRRSRTAGLSALVALLLANGPAAARIHLPRILSDGVVLQRDKPIHLWGWARAGERVEVQFQGARATTQANPRGEWQLLLPAFPTGPAGDIRIVGDDVVVIKNVLLGDVWIAAGQSNMQFPVVSDHGFGGVDVAARVVRDANHPDIHLFQVTREPATRAQANVKSAGWQAVTPETVKGFSAVAYLFGLELNQRYHVPIGLIEASWGGTPIQTWMGARSLRDVPEFAATLARETQFGAVDDMAYARYRKAMSQWYGVHGAEDRGHVGDDYPWAAVDFDDSRWSRVLEPQPWPKMAIPHFDGTLWLRKVLDLDAADLRAAATLHLCALLPADTTFVNGHIVGATAGEILERAYAVPAEFLKVGRNVVSIRLTGADAAGSGFVGLHGDAADLFVKTSRHQVSMAGEWRVEAGSDLERLPRAPAIADIRSPFPQAPALLYDGMIAPLTPFSIKGFLWYQGESDVSAAARYRKLFPAMIADWRIAWHDNAPFLFVQIAGFGRDGDVPTMSERADLRDAQAGVLSMPRVAMATAIDLGQRDNIHPTAKAPVAHRLALAAERLAYDEAVLATGPEFNCQRVEHGAIRLRFRDAGAGSELSLADTASHDFAIIGADGASAWGDATLEGNEVIVRNATISQPVAVRYAWSNTPAGVLRNREGLPSPPFDTTGRNCL